MFFYWTVSNLIAWLKVYWQIKLNLKSLSYQDQSRSTSNKLGIVWYNLLFPNFIQRELYLELVGPFLKQALSFFLYYNFIDKNYLTRNKSSQALSLSDFISAKNYSFSNKIFSLNILFNQAVLWRCHVTYWIHFLVPNKKIKYFQNKIQIKYFIYPCLIKREYAIL